MINILNHVAYKMSENIYHNFPEAKVTSSDGLNKDTSQTNWSAIFDYTITSGAIFIHII